MNNTLQQRVMQCGHMVFTLADLKEKIFPILQDNFKSIARIAERAILAPRNESIDEINLQLLHPPFGDALTFVSIDTTTDEHAVL